MDLPQLHLFEDDEDIIVGDSFYWVEHFIDPEYVFIDISDEILLVGDLDGNIPKGILPRYPKSMQEAHRITRDFYPDCSVSRYALKFLHKTGAYEIWLDTRPEFDSHEIVIHTNKNGNKNGLLPPVFTKYIPQEFVTPNTCFEMCFNTFKEHLQGYR